MNADRGRPFVRALPAVVLAGGLSALVAVAALLEAPPAPDWLTALYEAGAPRDRLVFTLAQATASTAAGLALGLLASWFLARPRLPLRWAFTLALLTPVAVPGVALALGLRELLGEGYRAAFLVGWAHAAFTLGVAAWVVTPAWGSGDRRLVDQAVLLGAPRWRAVYQQGRRAVAGPAILAAALGFTNAVTAVGTVMVLGGGDTWTVEALLLDEAAADRTRLASTLAGIQLLLGLVAFFAAWRWPSRTGRPRPASVSVRVLGAVLLVAIGALAVAPLVALVVGALGDEGGSGFSGLLDARVAGARASRLLAWTAVYAASAGLAAAMLAWLAADYVAAPRGGWWRSGWRYAPVGIIALAVLVSPVVVGVGAREVARGLDVDLQRTWAVMFGAHALVAVPVALRVLTSTRRADGAGRLVEASVLLGQTERAAAWRWRGRVTVQAVAAAALVAAALVAGEAGAAAVLAPDSATPAAVALLEAGREGAPVPAPALALAAVVGGAAVIAFGAGEWLRRRALGTAGTSPEAR